VSWTDREIIRACVSTLGDRLALLMIPPYHAVNFAGDHVVRYCSLNAYGKTYNFGGSSGKLSNMGPGVASHSMSRAKPQVLCA
jgi:hypothetical protein